ncbi:MAG TPA: response regulator [bacterium]|nr:response regulator [bacterium]HPN45986.1 response regulator [bacterium]
MILVVEDDQITQRIVSKLLGSTRYQIDITSDAYQAINYIKQNNYIIAIVDLVLPGPMNGINLIKEIKKHSPKTKIIACSSYGNQTHTRIAQRAGADMFVLKPFKPEELLTAVHNLALVNKKMVTPITTAKEEVKEESGKIPEIFSGFPTTLVEEIIKHGEISRLAQNDKHVLNFTEYIATVLSGSAVCFYRNRKLGILKVGESIGHEFIAESFDPDSTVILQALSPLEIMVIRSIDLIKFLHTQRNDLLQLFKVNVRTMQLKSIFNKEARTAVPNTADEQSQSPKPDKPEKPNSTNKNIPSDLYDFDATDLLGL